MLRSQRSSHKPCADKFTRLLAHGSALDKILKLKHSRATDSTPGALQQRLQKERKHTARHP